MKIPKFLVMDEHIVNTDEIVKITPFRALGWDEAGCVVTLRSGETFQDRFPYATACNNLGFGDDHG